MDRRRDSDSSAPRVLRAACACALLGCLLPAEGLAGDDETLVVMDIEAGAGVQAEVVAPLSDVLRAELQRVQPLKVFSVADMETILGKVAVVQGVTDCDTDACVLELAGALGADKMVAGRLDQVGGSYVMSLRLLDSARAVVENRVSKTAQGDAALLDLTRAAARGLFFVDATGERGGVLVLHSEPAATHLWLDGHALSLVDGKARAADVAPGYHEVVAVGPGLRAARRVFVLPDREQKLRLALVPFEAPVRIESQPSGASLRIDGEPRGKTPFDGALSAGTHDIEMVLPGHSPHRQSLLIMSPETERLEVALEGQAAPFYRSWWFWTAVGALVAGGTTGVVLGTRGTERKERVIFSVEAAP